MSSNPFTSKSGNIEINTATGAAILETQIGSCNSSRRRRNSWALKSGGRDDDTAATEESQDNAGDAFGGKESMKKKAKDQK
jgi:hypothetical protein